jgi:mannose-1-phosphate guanylyltransferase/mannose-6-phosphate isomerase
MVQPIVIAGGKGTRLWPVSRATLPKPFVQITGAEDTLLQATLRRLPLAAEGAVPLVVCNADHEFLVRDQAAKVSAGRVNLLLEPESRNTAPAVCAAALAIQRTSGSDEPILVLPADHDIADETAFAEAVKSGAGLARKGFLVTFAITPTEAATGYGYLRIGQAIDAAQKQFKLEAFVEKPDRQRAEQFLASGSYAWNSGMFIFQPSVLIAAFQLYQPEILNACRAALADSGLGTTMRLDPTAFAKCPSISIDYAIMEKSPNVATVIADLEWSDVGDWQAIWKIAAKDKMGNANLGNVLTLDSTDCLIRSDGPLLVGLGLKGMVAIATKDAVVVAPKDRAQDMKHVVDQLAAQSRNEVAAPKKVLRPWGSFEQLHVGQGFQVKEITVHPGAKLSLQRHRYRAEDWICIAGEGIATRGEEKIPITVNQAINIPRGSVHRLENPAQQPLRIIEVQIGNYTGEDDIERLEDIYGRV